MVREAVRELWVGVVVAVPEAEALTVRDGEADVDGLGVRLRDPGVAVLTVSVRVRVREAVYRVVPEGVRVAEVSVALRLGLGLPGVAVGDEGEYAVSVTLPGDGVTVTVRVSDVTVMDRDGTVWERECVQVKLRVWEEEGVRVVVGVAEAEVDGVPLRAADGLGEPVPEMEHDREPVPLGLRSWVAEGVWVRVNVGVGVRSGVRLGLKVFEAGVAVDAVRLGGEHVALGVGVRTRDCVLTV